METRLRSAKVKTQDGWVTFTRSSDNIESVSIDEGILSLRKENGDAVAFFNPLGWSHVEMEWERVGADS